MYLILLCFGTLFGLGAFFLLAGLLRLPTSASTKAVLTVTSRGKSQKGSINAILFDMAARLSPLVHLDSYKRKKLEAQLKSAEIKMSPETYIAAAWVKAGLIALLIIPALLIFPILAPVIVFLAVAVYFKEQKRADEIVQQRREEIEAELPRFVNTIEQELRASRDVLNILKSYQRNAGHAMKRELEITIADMASGNEENALTRMESRIGSTMLSDAAGVALEFAAVKIVADGNEAGMEKREHALDKVAGFNAVSPEAGKILDDDAVDLIGPHQLNELLYLRALEIRAAVSVVDELRDLRVQGFGHGCRIFMENKALIFNAQAVVLVILNGEADVEGNYIFLHCFSTSA